MAVRAIRPFPNAAACILGLLCIAAPALAGDNGPVYISFPLPAGLEQADSIIPTSVNQSLAVTGFILGAFVSPFVRGPSGTVNSFLVDGCAFITPWSINDQGAIVGTCSSLTPPALSFLRSPEGAITIISVPGSYTTFASSINAAGAITGYYVIINDAHGFVRSSQGNYTTFDVPGAIKTYGVSINAAGMIVGVYQDANQVPHCFVRSPWGSFTLFDLPGPLAFSPPRQNWAISMNAFGEIAGTYMDGNTGHGFVRTAQGTITSFDIPGGGSPSVFGIDLFGDVGGYYVDPLGGPYGFVRSPDGTRNAPSCLAQARGGPVQLPL